MQHKQHIEANIMQATIMSIVLTVSLFTMWAAQFGALAQQLTNTIAGM